MKYLENFENYLLKEGISFAGSCESIYEYLNNFIRVKLTLWENKKLDFSKMFNLTYNNDWLKNIFLSLKITTVKNKDDWDISGTGGYKKNIAFIEIRMYIPTDINISEYPQFNLMLDQVLRHEINHVYQNYKKDHIIDDKDQNEMLYYAKNLIEWYNKFNNRVEKTIHAGVPMKELKVIDLLVASYNMTKSEESSLLSQHSTKSLKKLDSRGEEFIRNILYENDFEEFYNKLINELFKEGYKLEYLNNIPKIISQNILKNMESKCSKWIYKLGNRSFKSFCKMMFINIHKRGKKYIKKVDKIHYLKNLKISN